LLVIVIGQIDIRQRACLSVINWPINSAAFIKSSLESDSPIVSAVAHYGVYYEHMNAHIGRMLSFVAAVMMSLISDALLDFMLMSIFLHSLERLCCFYSSCCSLEMVALVVFFVVIA